MKEEKIEKLEKMRISFRDISYSLFAVLMCLVMTHYLLSAKNSGNGISQFLVIAMFLTLSVSFVSGVISLVLKAFLNYQRELKKRCYIREDEKRRNEK